MHRFLQDQIEKHFGSTESLPPGLKEFIDDLNMTLSTEFSDLDQLKSQVEHTQKNFRLLLDTMPFGVTLINMDQKVIHANKAALKLMGYTSEEEIIGRLCHDTLCPAEKNKCPILHLNQTLDRSERILVTKDGNQIPIMKSVSRITYDGNEVLLEAFIDIREQKRINEITRKISSVSNIGELFANAVTLIKEMFDFYHVQLFRFNPSANDLTVVVGYGASDLSSGKQYASFKFGEGAVGEAAESRQSVMVASSNDDFLPESKCELALPIFLRDTLIAVLDIHSDKVDGIDPNTQPFLEAIGSQIAIIFESITLRSEMEDRLQELITLQQGASLDNWQTFQHASKPDSSRYTFDKSLGSVIPMPSDSNEDFLSSIDQNLISNPMAVRGEVIGEIQIEDDPERPLSEEEKRLLESITNEVAEALERARLLETSQRSAAELSVLNEMGNAFSEAFDERSIAEGIYTYSSKLMDVHQFYVAYYDKEDDIVSFPMVVNMGERITEDHPDWEFWKPRPAGDSLSGYIIKSRRPLLIENNAEEILGDMGLPFLKTGSITQSLLAVPLAMGDNIIGMVSTQSEEIPGLYNQHHLELLTSIASQASVAINNARLFQQEQERAEQERLVRTITDKVWRGADRQTIMRVALEELGKVLGADTSTIQLGTREQLLAKKTTTLDKKENSNTGN